MDELRAKLRPTGSIVPRAIAARYASLVAAGAVALVSCDMSDRQVRTGATSEIAAPQVVDSILPMDEALRRFRTGLAPVTELHGGARSVDDLVKQVAAALRNRDTLALSKLAISRAEYAYLYFPSSVYVRKPYELSPDVAWMLNSQGNAKGLYRLVARLADASLIVRDYRCAQPVTEGANSFLRSCTVTYQIGDHPPMSRRIFGPVITRDGRFKLLSYANDF